MSDRGAGFPFGGRCAFCIRLLFPQCRHFDLCCFVRRSRSGLRGCCLRYFRPPGGCVGGAGQPYGLKKSKEKRGDGLHLSDNAAMFKRAERNPVVAQMMAEYGEERCHELLHVTYTNK